MSNRLEKLLQFYQEDPLDPFTIYALALEYTSVDQEKAKVYYEKLLNEHPNYVATYYHAAQFYTELNWLEKAETLYKKGIDVSQKVKNSHAERELRTAYQNFLFENM